MAGRTLSIDTSGSYCSVALCDAAGEVLASNTSSGDGDHFEQLPGLVSQTAADAKVELQELTEIRIGVGPGSFTGIRIGMSFAKGLAWSLNVPLIGCSSFESLARSVGKNASDLQISGGGIAVVAYAGRGELFFGLYVQNGTVLSCSYEPSLIPISRIESGDIQIPPSTRWYTPARDFAERTSFVDASGSRPVVACVADIACGMPLVPTIPASNMDGAQALATLEPT
jgi:tRNA threonylcarbamoyl adenosine modification protein YeaZ